MKKDILQGIEGACWIQEISAYQFQGGWSASWWVMVSIKIFNPIEGINMNSAKTDLSWISLGPKHLRFAFFL